jgi:enamine deaminase RidA (YjgF/YER057c/UK114 family)
MTPGAHPRDRTLRGADVRSNIRRMQACRRTRPARWRKVMARIEDRLGALGLALPPPIKPPPGVVLPFRPVRVIGRRAVVSGHGPQFPDGSIATPLGKVGRDLSVEQAVLAARLTALSILGSLKRAIGDLDRVTAWVRVFGMVNSAPGFNRQPSVINGFSDLILELYGPEVGAHARSAVGMAELPFDLPVEIECEVEVAT